MRLNEENASLLNTKHNIENFYIEEIGKINGQLEAKNESYDELYSKYTRLYNSTNSKRIEDVSAWLKRQDTVQKTIISLEREVQDLKGQKKAIQQLKNQERILEQEELYLLRDEVKKNESFWKNQNEVFIFLIIKDLYIGKKRTRGRGIMFEG